MTWMSAPVRRRFSLVVLPALLAGCASLATPPAPVRTEVVVAVTASMELLTFNAGQPARILQRTPITGLPAGDALVGIDYRVARGVLYALSQAGRLYTLDARSGALQPVGAGASLALPQGAFGMDFNPTVDRIRVVGPGGLNLRLHPDTGAQVDGDAAQSGVQPDGALHYAADDAHAGQRPDIVAAAYTYNTRNEQLTTNYAIDRRQGTLVMQGSLEGAVPVVSPNTGALRTVGALGVGPLADAAFDISDVSNTALAVLRTGGQAPTRLYQIDLASGRATALGTVGDGAALLGIAIAP